MDDHSRQLIEQAFGLGSDLTKRMIYASKTLQNGVPELLRDISAHVVSGQTQSQPINHISEEPTAKKRKLEQHDQVTLQPANGNHGSYDISHPPKITFECKDVSFTSPLRKKLRLQFIHDSANTLNRQIRLVNQATNAVEYTLRGQDVDNMFCLPMPEKAQRQQTFVIFPLPGAQTQDGTPAEPLVWTMNETKGTPETVSVSQGNEEDTFVDVTLRELDHFMACLSKKTILPDEREFASEIPQSHRKGEKAFHTKAFRGSKEGYLFLLSTGIVFGFKKPVAYFPLASIESISFTSVLQRTFNIVITTLTPDPSNPSAEEIRTEHELSMVDQADFAPIDAYIRAHALNDASMAAERRAKAYNVNKPTAAELEAASANGGAAAVDERGEIEKAEELLQDEEDEEEEDYDPSGGESEGSGEESSDEEGEGYEDGEEGDEEEEWDEDEEVEADAGEEHGGT